MPEDLAVHIIMLAVERITNVPITAVTVDEDVVVVHKTPTPPQCDLPVGNIMLLGEHYTIIFPRGNRIRKGDVLNMNTTRSVWDIECEQRKISNARRNALKKERRRIEREDKARRLDKVKEEEVNRQRAAAFAAAQEVSVCIHPLQCGNCQADPRLFFAG